MLIRTLSAVLLLVVLTSPGFPQARPGTSQIGELTVRPGDVLQIKIWPNAELGGEFPIEETGLVYLPVLGAVQTAGRSITQLRADLRSRYAESMKSPVVTITPLFRVSVIGAVASPGVFFVAPSETLVDVILRAGGFNASADQGKVKVTRDGQTIQVDALASMTGNNASFSLRSDDRIVVPARHRLTLSALQTVLQIATLVIVSWNQFSK